MAKKKAGPAPAAEEPKLPIEETKPVEEIVDTRDPIDPSEDFGDDDDNFETVRIDNVGEIGHAELKLPKRGGGVLVLEGDNGTGKSTALGILNALLTKTGKLVPRDLAERGEVSGFDRKIRVAGTTTRSGDGEVNTIDPNKFDFGDLIDPPFDGMEARNTRRIQALIGLSGAAPKLELFVEAAGGKALYDKYLDPKDQQIRDPVMLASKLKNKIEAAARELEILNANDVNNKAACEATAKDLDLTQPSDATALQDALVAAANTASELRRQRKAFEESDTSVADAKAKIDMHSAGAAERMATLRAARTAAATDVDARKVALSDAEGIVAKLMEKLASARQQVTKLSGEKDTAVTKLEGIENQIEDAEEAARSVAGWQELIAASKTLKNPTDEEIEAAEAAERSAREAIDLGSKIRAAKTKLDEAKVISETIKVRTKQAGKLRERAEDVFSALSKMIPPGPLYVVGGQLVVDTPKRKGEPYQRLSDGERWAIALPYAIKAVGDGGFIVAPQSAWQDLSETKKPAINAECKAANVLLITGQVSTGPLRAEMYEPPKESTAGT